MRLRVIAATAICLLPTVAHAQAAESGRPNILFIMTDDHAAHAIGAYGSRVNQTPHLDRLAREGALLTSVFATNSICTPSRAAILTGQYSHINGVTDVQPLRQLAQTVAQLLQQGGYHTGHDRQVAPRQRSRRLRPLGDPAGPGRLLRSGLLHRHRREDVHRPLRHRRHHRPGASTSSRSRPRNKPFFLMCITRRRIGRGSPTKRTRAQFADRADPRAGDVLGLATPRAPTRCTRTSSGSPPT